MSKKNNKIEMNCPVCKVCYRNEAIYKHYGMIICEYGGPYSGYKKEDEK